MRSRDTRTNLSTWGNRDELGLGHRTDSTEVTALRGSRGEEQAVDDGFVQRLPTGLNDVLRDANGGPRPTLRG